MHEEAGAVLSDVSVRATPPVLEALACCANGMPYEALVARISESRGASAPLVRGMVEALCNHGLLINELRPPLTDSPVHHVIDYLRGRGAVPAISEALSRLLQDLALWEKLPEKEALERWPSLNAAAHAIEVHEPPFQIDAAFSNHGSRLHRIVGEEVCRAADILLRISSPPAGSVAAWRERFAETYGPWREVPLLKAIDPDQGLGLPDLRAPDIRRPKRDQLLIRLAAETLQSGKQTLELDEARVAMLATACGRLGALPSSLDLCFSIAAESAAAIDAGRFLLVLSSNAGVAPAGRMLGRFGHVFNAKVLSFLGDIPINGQSSIAAELMFEPLRARTANVMVRPLLRTHVILVNGGTPYPKAHVIPLKELALCLRADRLQLRWMREGVDVAVSSLHMLNYGLAPPLARFLLSISHDGEATIDRFSWGMATYLPFRPRVQSGRVVLRTAEWSLNKEFLDAFASTPSVVREKAALPRFVTLGHHDELLLVDLDSAAGMDLLRFEGKKLAPGASLNVQEALPGPEHAWVKSSDGHRLIEFVASLFRESEGSENCSNRPTFRQVPRSERLRPLTSDWLYGKFYLSRNLADQVISEQLRRLMEESMAARKISFWFFVRYADPTFHLRLRIAGDPLLLMSEVLPSLCTWASELMRRDVLHHFAFDTYERETERYGGPEALPLFERLFAADSVTVANLLAWQRSVPELERAHLAACTVDDLLEGLGLTPAARLNWYRRMAGRIHGAEYRTNSHRLRALLGDSWGVPPDPRLASIRSILMERRIILQKLGPKLVDLDHARKLWTPLDDILRSVVHMHCNRLCSDHSRQEERALELASRTLASLVAWAPGRVR